MKKTVDQPVEINLKDLLCYLLKKIAVILVIGVMCASIGLAYAYVQRKNTSETIITNKLNIDERLPNETDEEFRNRVNIINQANSLIQSIETMSSQVDMQNDYLSNSVLMQIYPSQTPTSNLQIVIKLDDNQPEGTINSIYQAYEYGIKSGDYLDPIVEEYGLGYDAVGELITVSHSSEECWIGDNDRVLVMNVSVVGMSTVFTDSVIDCILQHITNDEDRIGGLIASHTLEVLGRQTFVTFNADVQELQYYAFDYINNLQEQINLKNNILDNLALKLGLKDRQSFYVPVYADSIMTHTVSLAQYGGIGLFIGLLLAVTVYCINYIYGSRLLSQAQFSQYFPNVFLVGVCKPIGNRSAFNKYLDIITDNDTAFGRDQADSLLSANYKNITSKVNTVLVTSSIDNEEVRRRLEELNVTDDIYLNLFDRADVVKTASKYDGIVIVEQRGVSKKRMIRDEIKLLMNTGTKIIGAIII